jgi:hypothetical protein
MKNIYKRAYNCKLRTKVIKKIRGTKREFKSQTLKPLRFANDAQIGKLKLLKITK